ncbi:putative ATP-grasp-modified RiPP [Streptomyces scabiei]|uniref:putative ATP-grasp-modified RiPP n=1 Tax=Streptomyces TaxID=1883 RepID=UPI0029AA396D|nr:MULTISPECIES: putative ATP-grasp-modified RiPP [Streptomyces]MDX3298568.1 putative ATP-grasp-modified RiPP [Streptomyces scabiei]MDX3672676.1 putative ATP-grasp-modified RiPP [Streptomyces europaeiscabiei]
MTTALEREAFPLTPPGGRTPYSAEAPSGPTTRPWALRFARTPDSTGAVRIPAHAYDHGRQVNLSDDGGLLTCMSGTHTPTVPDGSTSNPPPLDEGPKD